MVLDIREELWIGNIYEFISKMLTEVIIMGYIYGGVDSEKSWEFMFEF